MGKILVRLWCVVILTVQLGGNPAMAEAAVAAAPAKDALAIDFNDVDIRVFIRYISELTGRNFVVDKDVTGKVTVISSTPVSADAAWRVFESVLEVHGYAAVEAGEVIKVVPVAMARGKNIGVRIDEPTQAEEGDRLVTQLIRLEYSNPDDVRKLLTPLMAKSSTVIAYAPARMLIITDVLSNLKRLVAIIRQIDVPGAGRDVFILPLRNAGAAAMARTLRTIFTGQAAVAGKQPLQSREKVKIVPYERTNMLIILADSKVRERIESLVRELDRETPGDRGNIHVYYLQYANAEELAGVLTSLPAGAGKKATPGKPRTFSQDVKIVADKATNSLVITAGLNDYQMLESVIRDLDIPRRMVYIEALIMEVNVEKDFTLGVEWLGAGKTDVGSRGGGLFGGFSGSQNSSGGAYDLLGTVQQSTLPPGFAMGIYTEAITVGEGNSQIVFPSLGALLQAYKKDTDVHILSTPQILTTDNEEARIQVGENVPYLTKEATGDQNYQTYEYRDVGVTLKITPQINQEGLVRLKIFQEVIKLKGNVDTFRPSTLKRVAETTVIVRDGATVVIGGIIGDDSTESVTKVPLLGDIPVLGRLFTYTNTTGNKTNLYVFITPRVISNPAGTVATGGGPLSVEPVVSGRGGTAAAVRTGPRVLTVARRLVALGYEKLVAGEYKEAESFYRKALLLEPENSFALLNLGVIAERTGRRQLAADLYRRVIVGNSGERAAVSTDPSRAGRLLTDIARDNLRELLDRPPADEQ